MYTVFIDHFVFILSGTVFLFGTDVLSDLLYPIKPPLRPSKTVNGNVLTLKTKTLSLTVCR